MGMFDTVYFDKAYTCPVCQGKINSVQVKAFENLLEDFHVGDCIGHPEDVRIIKDELYCDECRRSTDRIISAAFLEFKRSERSKRSCGIH